MQEHYIYYIQLAVILNFLTFLQEFGPGIANVLVGTDKGLETLGKNLVQLQKEFPAAVGTAVIGANLLRYGANIGKEIVGIVKVIKTAFPDKTDKKNRFVELRMLKII